LLEDRGAIRKGRLINLSKILDAVESIREILKNVKEGNYSVINVGKFVGIVVVGILIAFEECEILWYRKRTNHPPVQVVRLEITAADINAIEALIKLTDEEKKDTEK